MLIAGASAWLEASAGKAVRLRTSDEVSKARAADLTFFLNDNFFIFLLLEI
jgi:hypothetical protein